MDRKRIGTPIPHSTPNQSQVNNPSKSASLGEGSTPSKMPQAEGGVCDEVTTRLGPARVQLDRAPGPVIPRPLAPSDSRMALRGR